jgi:hypothetical protein
MLPFPGCQPGDRYGCLGQIYRRSANQSSPLLSSLVAHWRLEEASGTRFDSHGGNDLSENNSVGSAAGKLGNAVLFAAANEESLAIADNGTLSMGDIDFTIAGWVYFESLGSGGLVSKWGAGPVLEYMVYFNGTNLQFLISANGSAAVSITNSQAVSATTWYFFVAWHDAMANTINLTVNNNTAASLSHSTGVFDGTAAFSLGRNEEGLSWLDGRLDSVSIWKRILTSGERTQLHNSGNGLDYPFA